MVICQFMTIRWLRTWVFAGAPIEGPTHFSQFVPLLHQVFGDDWFVRGCISSHYQNMVVEGEEVQAMVEKTPTEGCANRRTKARWHTGINGDGKFRTGLR